ncbi:hypothetical protein AHF37_00895 [Paragonimus kellicotti]|nr:hypothetical protein AHF37_00895 [Paragonimus kellicotti]
MRELVSTSRVIDRGQSSRECFLERPPELASRTFQQLTACECRYETLACGSALGSRNRGCATNSHPRNKQENLSAALMKARGCEALEQLDEKRAAEESLCLAFSQHSLNPKQIPPPNARPVSLFVPEGVTRVGIGPRWQGVSTSTWSIPVEAVPVPEEMKVL